MVPSRGAIRIPAVAGRFYPADPRLLAETIDGLLAGAVAPAPATAPIAALVVPHAAYRYSGPVAASAYARLLPRPSSFREPPRRVALIGPAHYVAVPTAAVPVATAFVTPLGVIQVDDVGVAALVRAGLAEATDEPHLPEHSLEVQLPFLQRVLGDGWTLLPVAVGSGADNAAADILDAVADDETLVVCSTDLSHYLPHEQAVLRDRATATAVVGGDAAAIGDRDACGAAALRGFVRWAGAHRRRIQLLDLRTSGDTAGDRDRVVGYGAFLVPG